MNSRMNSRLAEACADARDCLTRAVALYNQHWEDAFYPSAGAHTTAAPAPSSDNTDDDTPDERSRGRRINPPGSKAPPSGDQEIAAMLRATVHHLTRCCGFLQDAPVEPPTDTGVLDATLPHPTIVTRHAIYAARCFDWAVNTEQLDDAQQRLVHHAARSCRSMLQTWDTPPATTATRAAEPGTIGHARAAQAAREHYGTAVRPPDRYPTSKRCADCGYALAEVGRSVCDACRQRRQREREAEQERARRTHRLDIRWDGVKAPHTTGNFDQCACNPRLQRARTRRKKSA